jgi:hypothetical protein
MAITNNTLFGNTLRQRLHPGISDGATKHQVNELHDGRLTYNQAKLPTTLGKIIGITGGFSYNTDGDWSLKMPLGTPPDLMGQATTNMNQAKQKHNTRERLRDKLAAKK